jgi:hypothetical protein
MAKADCGHRIWFFGGQYILVVREFSDKAGALKRVRARGASAGMGIEHILLERSRGHRSRLAERGDCALTRVDENIGVLSWRRKSVKFIARIAGEAEHIIDRNLYAFSVQKHKVLSHTLMLFAVADLIFVLGVGALPLIIVYHLSVWLMLTPMVYVKRHGPLRATGVGGGHEPMQPAQSWKHDATISSSLLPNVRRRSDHHPHSPPLCSGALFASWQSSGRSASSNWAKYIE